MYLCHRTCPTLSWEGLGWPGGETIMESLAVTYPTVIIPTGQSDISSGLDVIYPTTLHNGQ